MVHLRDFVTGFFVLNLCYQNPYVDVDCRVCVRYGRYPGQPYDASEEQVEQDVGQLTAITAGMLEEWGVKAEADENCMQEMARAAGCEVHNIAAFLGGVGSQVALKVLLQQYVPLNNTLIFNGIHGACSVYPL